MMKPSLINDPYLKTPSPIYSDTHQSSGNDTRVGMNMQELELVLVITS